MKFRHILIISSCNDIVLSVTNKAKVRIIQEDPQKYEILFQLLFTYVISNEIGRFNPNFEPSQNIGELK